MFAHNPENNFMPTGFDEGFVDAYTEKTSIPFPFKLNGRNLVQIPLDFEPNGIPFGSKSKGKLSPRSYSIRFERKWKHSFVSVG